ncbi:MULTISPECIES: 1-phosphofructokinase family hexose kinase [Kocuria]|uniref:1-phosphofructokinase family hexose kinase n=1 Tax=Kocuria TaxID=57493 RepID=UPI0006604E82|nr:MULTISPECIES: 1-phosphofructokinase family hexose kinase [Kocuria]MCT1366391.1 1-phosphofructokinase family hexose kinase [Rothia sp. p3-SID1597]RUQ21313.1 1-phosphofructokinase family hexose kinase [Kocuria sp. HSID16901]
MIVTLTANPSLDRTVEIPAQLGRGTVIRATRSVADPGGKGVNIARALSVSGVESVAVLPGDSGDPVLAGLTEANVRYSNLATGYPIRTNVTIAEPDGTTTKINAPGEPFDDVAQRELTRLLINDAKGASWLVLAGSLPPGVPSDYYAVVSRAVREVLGDDAPRMAVDTSGASLRDTLIGQDGLPDLIKPNSEELAELVGGSTDAAALEDDPQATAQKARELVDRGVGSVLATMGAKGAVLVTPDGAWYAQHAPIRARSTVGAGDCSLAGFLLADEAGKSPRECLVQAVAHGSAAASLPGTQVPSLEETTPEAVTVTELR